MANIQSSIVFVEVAIFFLLSVNIIFMVLEGRYNRLSLDLTVSPLNNAQLFCTLSIPVTYVRAVLVLQERPLFFLLGNNKSTNLGKLFECLMFCLLRIRGQVI